MNLKLQKILNYTSVITLLSAFIMLFVVLYWLIYPYKVIEIESDILIETEVQAGGYLTHELTYCKYMDLESETVRAFINGVVFTTPLIITNNPVGCRTNSHRISVPSELPSGEYRLQTTWTYQVNPIREIKITFTTEDFKVLGSDVQRQLDQN